MRRFIIFSVAVLAAFNVVTPVHAAPAPAPLVPFAAPPDIFCGFVDVPYQSYYTEPACWLKERAITNGVSPTEYGPTGTVTRAQAAAFLWRSAGSPSAVTSCGFTDATQIPTWARQGACWLKAKGGLTSTTYRPNDNITRAEMALMLWAANNKPASPSSCGFTDEAQIPTWARAGACWLKATGITTNNPYRPTANVTRAEMAAFLWRNAGRPTVNTDTLSNTNGTAAVLWYKATDANRRTVTLPTWGGTITVDWGDGATTTTYVPGVLNLAKHTYDSEGYFRVKVTGNALGFGFPPDEGGPEPVTNHPVARSLVAVSSFGDLGTFDLTRAFFGAVELLRVPNSIPADTISIAYAFSGPLYVSTLNAPAKFNDRAVTNWNTANTLDMTATFQGATTFNQNISTWNTAKVEWMTAMFAEAPAFNQPIGNWNTAKVGDMSAMFRTAQKFNQPLNNWNTSAVTATTDMFNGATNFNQNISTWNTTNIKSMRFMFAGATNFNQNISTWNTTKVTDTGGMFSGASAYNQPLNNWNTANIMDMAYMFAGATKFNQPLNNWNTTQAKTMRSMFYDATNFNQNISTWNVANVTDWNNFRTGSPLSTTNTPPKFR